MFELLESTAFGAAIVFGFRHGFDWDHIAALTDLTGSQQSPRRSMFLATLYASGHAVMVLVLGLVAIVFAEQLPDSVDVAMGRFVGVTLIALGIYIAWTLVRHRGQVPVRSRWMLLLSALQRVVRWARRTDQPVVVEHSHPHDHDQPMHSHDHFDEESTGMPDGDVKVLHSHTHRHVATMPTDPFMTYGTWSAFGIGLLHGIGAETPTQVLIFAAAANASGTASSIGVLVCFIIGILASNTLVAVASIYGFRSVARQRSVVTVLSVVTAVFSLVVGMLFLTGQSATLPAMLGG